MKEKRENYDSVFDYALDNEIEKDKQNKQLLDIKEDFINKLVYVNGVECTFESFITLSSELFKSYYLSILKHLTFSKNFVVYTTPLENRNITQDIKFYTLMNGSIRLIATYNNEISDTFIFDKTYKNGHEVAQEFFIHANKIIKCYKSEEK